MDKHLQIRELQEKAFNGDTEALELYNEYVSRGEAPAIRLNVVDTSEYKDMYADSKTFKRTTLVDKEVTRPVHEMSAIEKMMLGFKERDEQKTAEGEE